MFGQSSANTTSIFGSSSTTANSIPSSFQFPTPSIFGLPQNEPAPQQKVNKTVKPAQNTSTTSKSSNLSATEISTPLPEDALEICKCEYCNCYISIGPIRIIDNKVACGRCHRDSDGLRLPMVEALARQFTFPCRYKSGGCNAIFKWALVDEHEKVCDYREIECTIFGCDWKGAKSTLKAHFDQKHADEIVNSKKSVVMNLDEKKNLNLLYATNNKAFLVNISNDGEKIQHNIKFFCTSLIACMYKYNICVSDSNKNLMFLNQNMQSFDDELEAINVGIPLDMLKSVFLKSDDVKITFQIKHGTVEPKDVSIDSIECPVCLEPMLSNIYIGQCGHSFCVKCKRQLQNCPCCRSNTFGSLASVPLRGVSQEIRNYTLESLIRKLNLEL